MNHWLNKFIICVLLVSCNFFYLAPISIWNSLRIMNLAVIVFIMINSKLISKSKGKFSVQILIFLIMCIFEFILSKLNYNQSSTEILVTTLYYFVVLIYFIIVYYSNNDTNNFIKNCFVWISLILSIILISQMIVYELFTIKFLTVDIGERLRFGQVRLSEGGFFISLGIIISIGKMVNKKIKNYKVKLLYISTILLGGIYLILVSKTRGMIFSISITIILMLIITVKGIVNKLKVIAVIGLIGLVFVNSPIYQQYLDLSQVEKGSTDTRVEEVTYYLNETIQSPLFGTGIINATNPNDYAFNVVRGPNGSYFQDDVGIIGFANEFGMLGLIWYIWIIVSCFRILVEQFKDKSIFAIPENIGIFIFICLTSITLIVMDSVLLVYFPFVLYILESYSNEPSTDNILKSNFIK